MSIIVVILIFFGLFAEGGSYRGTKCLQRLQEGDQFKLYPNILLNGQMPCVLWESGIFLDEPLPYHTTVHPQKTVKADRATIHPVLFIREDGRVTALCHGYLRCNSELLLLLKGSFLRVIRSQDNFSCD